MGVVGLCAVLIASYTMETNIFLNPFVSGVEDVTEQTGTAAGRSQQLETDIEVFKQYPYIGGGTSALGSDDPGFANIARKTDLGYSHWLKHYGILGIAWLLLFLIMLFSYTRKLQKILPRDYRAIAAFSMSYLIFFTVSFVTLNHLMFRGSTLVMCLYCAITRASCACRFLPRLLDQIANWRWSRQGRHVIRSSTVMVSYGD